MKKIILVAALIAGFTSAQAQEGVRLGVKGSYFSTWLFNKNVSDQDASLDYASTFSTTFGAQAVFMFAETYGMSAEIVAASHKQKYDGLVGNSDDLPFTNEIKLNYIDIPVMFRVSSPKGPYFELGPQFCLLTGAKETFTLENDPLNFSYTDKDVKDDFNGFGVAGVLGFGIDIKLSEMINLTTGLRFGYMFSDATTEYTEAELDNLGEKASMVSAYSHYTADSPSKFDYKASNRVFGGLQLGLQFQLGK
ncbi:MAG: porin family protein [Bacteroidia bacterium]